MNSDSWETAYSRTNLRSRLFLASTPCGVGLGVSTPLSVLSVVLDVWGLITELMRKFALSFSNVLDYIFRAAVSPTFCHLEPVRQHEPRSANHMSSRHSFLEHSNVANPLPTTQTGDTQPIPGFGVSSCSVNVGP
ncbi:hypothetical protein BDN72DRAFT_840019 [Pluteus cervinus]|uniref:Uncharacterized protein n=1 Tax=Pluteus cervinus TaxID=181527 RepID=A0ACD3AVG1_9AGAR|nr:hypothetical protein BDN72DRAFT_840019 [Pluteus cervinus]